MLRGLTVIILLLLSARPSKADSAVSAGYYASKASPQNDR